MIELKAFALVRAAGGAHLLAIAFALLLRHELGSVDVLIAELVAGPVARLVAKQILGRIAQPVAGAILRRGASGQRGARCGHAEQMDEMASLHDGSPFSMAFAKHAPQGGCQVWRRPCAQRPVGAPQHIINVVCEGVARKAAPRHD
ncbi:MAG: hypothetical protein COY86_10215 [Rhodobacterales bacterium CG_4_10_14_0_8_um_filter_70_9]|nr:MAG: hypothetical protein COY86_10215 [Rhodobacterales bacterium CG_4_10_14_0_8_um_filter_70_9]